MHICWPYKFVNPLEFSLFLYKLLFNVPLTHEH